MTEYFARPSVDLISALEEFALFLDDHGSSSAESEDDNYAPSTALESLDQVGIIPSWQQIRITLRDVSYNFMTGRKKDTTIRKEETQPEFKREIKHSYNSATKDETNKLIDEGTLVYATGYDKSKDTQTEISDGLGDADDEADVEGTVEAEAEAEAEAETNTTTADGNAEDDEDDEDEMEEIGRLPNFHQLQFTLRNASEMISASMFGNDVPNGSSDINSHITAPDLLRKWGGPLGGGGLGWHNFMQSLQLPSFLTESHSEDDDEPVNIQDYPEIYREDNLTEEDLSAVYNHEGLSGCDHYLRLCKTECDVCKKFYTCQMCHDEVELHEMDRRKVKRMLCMNCKRPQPPNRKCVFCKEVMGDYYCGKCKLWSDDPDKQVYHCDKCEICRVGRGHNIDTFHCDKCGICMALTVKNNHKCIERAANSGCPICLEDLFSSTKPTVFMPCGHPIHNYCFKEYTKRFYRCPICAKSIFDTSALFRMVDEEIKCEVLPPELANKRVRIVCQDCRLKSHTDFHLAGLKCETCGSYNTSQI